MMDAKTVLFVALALSTLFYLTVLVIGVRRVKQHGSESTVPTPGGIITGAIANFFDALGIGSFALQGSG